MNFIEKCRFTSSFIYALRTAIVNEDWISVDCRLVEFNQKDDQIDMSEVSLNIQPNGIKDETNPKLLTNLILNEVDLSSQYTKQVQLAEATVKALASGYIYIYILHLI